MTKRNKTKLHTNYVPVSVVRTTDTVLCIESVWELIPYPTQLSPIPLVFEI